MFHCLDNKDMAVVEMLRMQSRLSTCLAHMLVDVATHAWNQLALFRSESTFCAGVTPSRKQIEVIGARLRKLVEVRCTNASNNDQRRGNFCWYMDGTLQLTVHFC
jgi:hypothetical protein